MFAECPKFSGTKLRRSWWKCKNFEDLAPQVGLEPTTLRLTAECSAIELLRSVLAGGQIFIYVLTGYIKMTI